VIVGREGEPHPVEIMRKFLALAEGGQMGPELAAKATEVSALMKELKATLHLDEASVKAEQPAPAPKVADGAKAPKQEVHFKLTFDQLMPALPLPLEGVMGKLYQLSWAEGFDPERVDQKLRASPWPICRAARSPATTGFSTCRRNAYEPVQDAIVKEGVKQNNIGFFKRAALKTALVVFKPAVKKGVEAMRRGMLYMAVLRAESGFSRADINDLTGAYVKVLMPILNSPGSERDRRAGGGG